MMTPSSPVLLLVLLLVRCGEMHASLRPSFMTRPTSRAKFRHRPETSHRWLATGRRSCHHFSHGSNWGRKYLAPHPARKDQTERRRSPVPLFSKVERGEDDDGFCSISNLDACIPEECSIDHLDACVPTSVFHLGGNGINGQTHTTASLRTFLANPMVEVLLAVLVILSSFAVGLGTLPSLPPSVLSTLNYFEIITTATFTLEYFARWKLANFSPKYVVEPLAIIDLIAILPAVIKLVALTPGLDVPSVLSTSEALINLRLLRILRLQNVLVDYETFAKFEVALGLSSSDTRPYQLQLARVVLSIFTLLSVTAGLIYSAEHVVNPSIPDYFTAVYFSLITLTTVGFGDIAPMTNAGKWVLCGSILVGSAVVPAQAAALIEALLNRDQGPKEGSGGGGNKDSIAEDIVARDIAERLDRLEETVEDTNERIDDVVELLQALLEQGSLQTSPIHRSDKHV